MAGLTEQEARGLDLILKSLGAVGYAVCIVRADGHNILSTSGGMGFDGAADAFASAHRMRQAGGGAAIANGGIDIAKHKRGRG